METKNLLEQWNKRMVQGNRLSGEIEEFENILSLAEQSKVCIHNNGGTTFLGVVLDEKVMNGLKTIVLNTLVDEKKKKVAELEQLINPGPIKTSTINPEFEKTVQEMEQSGIKTKENVVETVKSVIEADKSVPKVELTVELVKDLYIDKDMIIADVAKVVGVPKSSLYRFIVQNNLTKPSKKEKELFRDSKVQAKKPR
jgi:hypothetical protein